MLLSQSIIIESEAQKNSSKKRMYCFPWPREGRMLRQAEPHIQAQGFQKWKRMKKMGVTALSEFSHFRQGRSCE